MGQSNVGIRLSIDAAQAKGQVEDLSRAISGLNTQIKQAAEAKDWKSAASISLEIEEAASARSKIMEMAKQTQGGLPGQAIDIDTSQAISNIRELDNTLAKFQEHLRAARENKDWVSAGQIEKIIGETASARSKIMEARSPDELMRHGQETGDWKPAAERFNRDLSPPAVPQIPPAIPPNTPSRQHIQTIDLKGKTGDIHQRIIVDVGQTKSQIEELSRVIDELNEKMKEAAEAKDWKSVAQFSQAIDNASSGRGKLMAQANQAQAQQAQAQAKEGFFGGQGAWVLQQSLNQITHGILSAWDAALTAAKQRASGDYAGSVVSQRRARGEIAGQGIGTAVGALGFLGGPMLGMLMMGLGGEIGRFLGGIGSKKMEEALAWSSAYKSALPSIDSLNQLYGGAINRQSADANNRQGLAMHDRAHVAARGTGLDTDDFIQAMTQMGNYGITSETQALNMTRQQALWSRFTGADLGTIQKVSGQAKRYAGEDNAVSVAYGGLKAQDMGKGQFTEFLNAMERILEDGISKGFVRSTEEIASNMALLYRLSGGSPLWQGEQGAQRLSQMNAAVSNATNLQSVEDVISYSVARDLLGRDNPDTAANEREGRFINATGGNILNSDANFRAAAESGDNVIGTVRQGQRMEIMGVEGDYFKVNNSGQEGYVHKTMFNNNGNVYTGTWVDEMQLLERGVSADLLQGQWEAVRRSEKGINGYNDAAIIERFKNMYGLNYTGASQVWAMMRDSKDWTDQDWQKAEQDIKRFQGTPGYQSDSQKLQDILNSIKNDGIKIGKIEFDQTELPAIREAAQEIADILRKKEGPRDTTGMAVDEAVQVRYEEWRESSPGREARNARDAYEAATWDEHNYQDRAAKARIDLSAPRAWHGYFSASGNSDDARNDRESRDTIIDIVKGAINSNYPEQLDLAEEFISLINSVPSSTRSEWNESNSINQLANADGIQRLLTALQTLIKVTEENGNIDIDLTL